MSKPILDLSNCNGNAVSILSKARKEARRAKWPEAKIDKFLLEAKSSDYDQVIQTCMKYFDVE